MRIISRYFRVPATSFFLFGPRGTGKSLWTKTHFPNALCVDLLDLEIQRRCMARPEYLRELIEGHPAKKQVLIDEVQKVPELLQVVHSLIESKKGIQFILTGSSARKLKRSGTDLMAGRAVMRTMHPYMASEVSDTFSLEKALKYGLLPLVLGAPDPEDVLRSYVGLYLKEEVQMEGLVRNIGDFSRFLETVSFSHGSILNISNIARDCQVKRKTVESYISILEDLLLAFQVPVFTKRAKRELSFHPKLFLFDTGVFRSLRPHGPLDRTEEIDGMALEGLVAQHLRAWIAHSKGSHELYFWQTRSQVEVDFVVYGDHGIFGFEVKNTTQIRPENLRGLQTFQTDYPEAKCFFLYRGRDKRMINGILCIPCEEALLGMIPDRFQF